MGFSRRPARVFLDLSVGRKLALSAGVAFAMLGGLVAIATIQAGEASRQRAVAERAIEASQAASSAITDVAVATGHIRNGLLSNLPDVVTREAAAAQRALAAAATGLERASTLSSDEAGRRHLAAATAGFAELREAYEATASTRLELIARRDQELFPRFAELDQAHEAASANLQFAMSGDAREEARDVLTTFTQAVNEVRLSLQRYLATGDSAAQQRVRRAAAQQRVHARRLLAVVNDEARPDMQRLTAAAEAMSVQAEAVLGLAVRSDEIRAQRNTPARERVVAALSEARTALDREAAAATEAAHAADANITMSIWIVGAVVALLLGLSTLLATRTIGAPLRRLAGVVQAIASGSADAKVRDRDRADEIGQIASALDDMRGSVGEAFARGQMLEQLGVGIIMADPATDFRIGYVNPKATEQMRLVESCLGASPTALVGGRLASLHPTFAALQQKLTEPRHLPHTERVALGGEVFAIMAMAIKDRHGNYVGPMLMVETVTAEARLAQQFDREVGSVIEAVAVSAAQMKSSAASMTDAAQTSRRDAEAVAETSGRAGLDVQAVAASAEELAASVSEITRQVSEGAGVAKSAAGEAQAADATVQGLAVAAQKIGEVVRLISDIAGQTNLLALNATIEAARAGEAGKGFAVVASEVKQLANQTAKATDDIASQIAGVQGATEKAVLALRSVSGTIGRLNDVTAAIAAAVEQQGAATQEIARNAALVASSTSSVAERIVDVRGAAMRTGEAAGEVMSAAEQLAARAAELKEQSKTFLAAL
jgi:methyl-accepting chemotaxis protein